MFRRSFIALAALVASVVAAAAQSPCPAIINGAVLTAAQWNACFQAKNDTLLYPPVNRNGDAMLGRLTAVPSVLARAGFSLGVGVAPTTPVDGDMWLTTGGIFARINGATFQLVSPGAIAAIANGGTGANNAPQARSGTNLNIWGDSGTGHGDANVVIAATERMAYTNAAFTAPRTWTLPAANATGFGPYTVQVTDMAAGVTGANTLTIQRAGADTINGAGTSVVIAAASGSYICVSDGTSKWSCQSTGAASAGGVSTAFGRSGAVAATSGDYASYQITGGGQGSRNKIINGNFLLDQRVSGLFTVTASNTYIADRWMTVRGTNVSSTQLRSPDGPTVAGGGDSIPNYLRVIRTLGNAGTGVTSIGQIIESSNMVSLAGKTATCSFYARAGANYSPAAGALAWVVRTGTTADEGNTNFFSGAWTGNANPISTSATLTTSWQRFSSSATVAAGAIEMGISFSATWVGTAGVADYFDITGVQCEVGAGATEFEKLLFSTQLSLAQRYYEKTFSQGTVPAQNNAGAGGYIGVNASSTTAGTASVSWNFKATKRVAPTITTFNPFAAGTGFSQSGAGNVAATVTVTSDSATTITVSGAMATANFMGINATADSEL